jgi:hypothetical protein
MAALFVLSSEMHSEPQMLSDKKHFPAARRKLLSAVPSTFSDVHGASKFMGKL